MDYRFGKDYKLCRKKLIENVFQANQTVKKYPFLLYYKFVDEPLEKPFQVVISAPKRNFKRAVQRNRVKRLMREVIRHKKQPLEEFLIQNGKYLILFWVYTSSEIMEYEVLKEKFDKLLERLMNDIHERVDE